MIAPGDAWAQTTSPPAAEGGQLWVAADSSILLLRIQLHSGGANEVQPEA
ncbi:MAG TPA: hypothetical protein VMT39_00440 [Candidatus Bathyarchaeia archaeon]|nr:hypothetical protein [Candidatus Bathyarchaeia archaeon]